MSRRDVVIIKTLCGCWQELVGYGVRPPPRIVVPLRNRELPAVLFRRANAMDRYPERFRMRVRIFEYEETDSHGTPIYVEREG